MSQMLHPRIFGFSVDLAFFVVWLGPSWPIGMPEEESCPNSTQNHVNTHPTSLPNSDRFL